ncbi:MAG: flagellar hook-basal body complex protein FliE [Nitrospirota bacterium]
MAIEPVGTKPIPSSEAHAYNYTLGIEKEKTFSDTMKESILKVNNVQVQADQAIVDLTTARNQDIHQTMIAVEKAEVTFQLMMQVRNKLISAYEEISRMQV